MASHKVCILAPVICKAESNSLDGMLFTLVNCIRPFFDHYNNIQHTKVHNTCTSSMFQRKYWLFRSTIAVGIWDLPSHTDWGHCASWTGMIHSQFHLQTKDTSNAERNRHTTVGIWNLRCLPCVTLWERYSLCQEPTDTFSNQSV